MRHTYANFFRTFTPVERRSKRRSPRAFPAADGGDRSLVGPANRMFVLHALMRALYRCSMSLPGGDMMLKFPKRSTSRKNIFIERMAATRDRLMVLFYSYTIIMGGGVALWRMARRRRGSNKEAELQRY